MPDTQPEEWVGAVAASFVNEPGKGICRDITQGEVVEGELDRFIELRDKQRIAREGEREAEAAWKESERRVEAQRRERNRQAWIEHCENQARRIEVVMGTLVNKYREEADKLRDGAA